eukprot:jgi/Galph1/2978/GphlegSOOS_G1595.1
MWRIACDRGRQWWEYCFDDPSPEETNHLESIRKEFVNNKYLQKHSSDGILRSFAQYRPLNESATVDNVTEYMKSLDKRLENTSSLNTKIERSIASAIRYFRSLQMSDGHWPGDYGGPMFLLPGLIIVCYITQTDIGAERRNEMQRYLINHQNQDGGWGLHIESHSSMFGTAMNYVALRLLGMDRDDPTAVAARNWILQKGGAVGIPSWGKLYLAVLGLYGWEGLNPLTPEMWILPYWLPIHPGRFWCHCRIVYLPMSYLYGRRATAKETPLIGQLREELYLDKFETIDWDAQRENCCKEDIYTHRPRIQSWLWWMLSWYEKLPIPGKHYFRDWALKETLLQVKKEDENTQFICIGPVNKVLNMLCCYFDDPHSEHFQKHIPRLYDYLWIAEDGMKMQGYNGSQLWDTAFAAQALSAAGSIARDHFPYTLQLAHHYLDIAQVREDIENGPRYYRHISKGAWPFSTRDHGWPISDCTAEGLKAVLALESMGCIPKESYLSHERLFDAIHVSLSLQNKDGGWATYENTKSYAWLEWINPSEVFGDIMIDYSCVECTSSSIQGLAAFRARHPGHRRHEIDLSIERGSKYIEHIQGEDGSWYGSWGVCFTYGTWFGVEGLVSAGRTFEACACLPKACKFLCSKQKQDGSWGETYRSCTDKQWMEAEQGQLVQTAWAVIALIKAISSSTQDDSSSQNYSEIYRAIDKGIHFLLEKQNENGDWPQQRISGVFNRNCMISYSNYRNVFPLWAIALYRSRILEEF